MGRSRTRRTAATLWRAGFGLAVAAAVAAPAALLPVAPAAATETRASGTPASVLRLVPATRSETCTTADLLLRAGPSGAVGAHRYAVYDLVDGSAAACTVRGFPSTQLLRPLGRPVAHLRELHSTRRGADSPAVPVRTVHLTPGSQSDFWMEWTPRVGRLRGSLAVTPPQRRTAIVVHNRLVPLDARSLTVSPVTSSVLER